MVTKTPRLLATAVPACLRTPTTLVRRGADGNQDRGWGAGLSETLANVNTLVFAFHNNHSGVAKNDQRTPDNMQIQTM